MLDLDDMARDTDDILSDAEDFLNGQAERDENAQANIVLILSQLSPNEKLNGGERRWTTEQALIIEKATELREQWESEEEDDEDDEDDDDSNDDVILSSLNVGKK